MSDNRSGQHRRWHDEFETIDGAIQGMEGLPSDFQSIIAQGINLMAERNMTADEALKQIGKDKVMGLFKSKQKRRAYDRNADYHKTINYLFVLSDKDKEILGQNFFDITVSVVQYVSDCEATEQLPQTEIVENMAQVFVHSNGSKEAVDAYLRNIHPEFAELRKSRPTSDEPTPGAASEPLPTPDKIPLADTQEDVIDESRGMRIRQTDS